MVLYGALEWRSDNCDEFRRLRDYSGKFELVPTVELREMQRQLVIHKLEHEKSSTGRGGT